MPIQKCAWHQPSLPLNRLGLNHAAPVSQRRAHRLDCTGSGDKPDARISCRAPPRDGAHGSEGLIGRPHLSCPQNSIATESDIPKDKENFDGS